MATTSPEPEGTSRVDWAHGLDCKHVFDAGDRTIAVPVTPTWFERDLPVLEATIQLFVSSPVESDH